MQNYRVENNVKWTVELHSIMLWDQEGCVHDIEYPQAAVWDFVSRGYSTSDIISRITHIATLTQAEASILVNDTLNQWLNMNVIGKKII